MNSSVDYCLFVQSLAPTEAIINPITFDVNNVNTRIAAVITIKNQADPIAAVWTPLNDSLKLVNWRNDLLSPLMRVVIVSPTGQEYSSSIAVSPAIYKQGVIKVGRVKPDSIDPLFPLKPFSLSIWIAVALSITVLSLNCLILERIVPDCLGSPFTEKGEKALPWQDALLFVWSTYFFNRFQLRPKIYIFLQKDHMKSYLKTTPEFLEAQAKYPAEMFVGSDEQAIERMKSDISLIYFVSAPRAKRITLIDCDFQLFGQEEGQTFLVFPVSLTWLQFPHFVTAIQRLQDEQYFIYLFSILIGLFLLLFLGLLLAFTSVLIEYLYKRLRYWWIRRKLPKFEFGKSYEAKIQEVRRDGIMALVNLHPDPFFIPNADLSEEHIKFPASKKASFRTGDTLKVKYFGKNIVNKQRLFAISETTSRV
ncbi:hypothetical protein Ciccas_005647 [Cichlidogyrus casuarinus]|uniref:S1 motif domain-containing protein n=1 Tax=Cichlidogyrus casuarinus TaxID=1844966 RepID=A0ABD2QAF2_9PLAT